MRQRPTSTEHAEAVSRRLATLSAELSAVRGDPLAVAPEHRHTAVRGLLPVTPVDPTSPGALPATPVPVPGRHAARRLGSRILERLPIGPTHLALVAVVVAVAVGLAAWFAVRGDPEPVPALAPVEQPLTVPESSATPSPAGVASGGATPAGAPSDAGAELTVDVAGKVRRPGIAVLPPGSRVVDALEAAGGARGRVDLTSLNLARPLVDGEQILVGVPVPGGVTGTLGASGGASTDGGALVNINTADQAALETLPGVGPVTAEAIMSWRSEHGGFTAVEELLEVDGIGDATLADIAPHVTI